jgi:hypothetical protein
VRVYSLGYVGFTGCAILASVSAGVAAESFTVAMAVWFSLIAVLMAVGSVVDEYRWRDKR